MKRVVQLVEKYANGKIRKNQSLDIETFVDEALNHVTMQKNMFIPQPGFWDRAFQRKNYQDYIGQVSGNGFETGFFQCKRELVFGVHKLIDKDSVGKSKKK